MTAINKKSINVNKIDDEFKKRQYIQKDKNLIIKDINKKNSNIIIINNIKINNNNNNNKKNMTIIQNLMFKLFQMVHGILVVRI